jgi:hypothetical protein
MLSGAIATGRVATCCSDVTPLVGSGGGPGVDRCGGRAVLIGGINQPRRGLAPEPPRTPGQHGLGGVDRLEPQPGLPHPRRGAMGLCHDRLPILPLPADEGGPWTAWRP